MDSTSRTLAKLKTPHAELVPPLSTAEFEVLKADIKANGVRVPVEIDEDSNILDGHHRYKCDKDAPTVVIAGLTELEKKAYVIKANVARRNLSPSQKKDLRKKQQKLCKELKADKSYTQAKLAVMLGVSRRTIDEWLEDTTNVKNDTTCTPGTVTDPATDSRVKVDPKAKPVIAERVAAGESQAQVAADYGITQQAVSTICTAEAKHTAAVEQREEAAAKITTNCGVIHGDFRKAGAEPESVDLIFTDPPYDEKSTSLYKDLAEYAAHVLTPGGWVLAYSGKFHLPQVYEAFSKTEGLVYGWTFAILHSGGDDRIRKFHLQSGWKPIIAAYRPPLTITWQWFKDVVTGGKEKELHEWQQAESEAAYFIEKLCPQVGTVCDPFCGSGTTLAAAKSLGRQWIGFEINEEHVTTARVRLNGKTTT
jgi:transcriptional regulator with XRE-family HTH domain